MLDKRDSAILKILTQNSRLSIREIAKKTAMRPSTVHERIKKLKANSIIEKFTVKLNNKAVGESFIVFMLVKTKPPIMLDTKLLHYKSIKEVFGITGEYDILLKLKFMDVDEFNNFIINFRKEQKIESTMTMVATANVKEEI